MTDLFDLYHIFRDHGASAILVLAVVAGLIFIAFLFFRSKYDSWSEKMERVDMNLLLTREATDKLLSLLEETHADLHSMAESQKVIASEEHWKHCPLDRCPNLGRVNLKVDECLKVIEQFAQDGKNSRSETRAIVERIVEKQDALSNEIIAILRQIRVLAANGK